MKKADRLFPGGEYINMAESQFFAGFADETGLTIDEAKAQWAGFSRNLSDAERRSDEALGFVGGQKQGKWFNRQFRADLFK